MPGLTQPLATYKGVPFAKWPPTIALVGRSDPDVVFQANHITKLDESTARRQLKSSRSLSGRSIHLTLVTKWSRSWSWMTYCHTLCAMSIGPTILRYSYFKIWPWKSMVKVMCVVKGQWHVWPSNFKGQDYGHAAANQQAYCTLPTFLMVHTLRWRHNGPDSVSNHQPHDCLLNRLFRRRSKKTSKLRATGLCAGNSPGTGELPAQMGSYAENVSIWWRYHDSFSCHVDWTESSLHMYRLLSKASFTNIPF